MSKRRSQSERQVGYVLLWINVVIGLLQFSAGNYGMVVLHIAVVILLGCFIKWEE